MSKYESLFMVYFYVGIGVDLALLVVRRNAMRRADLFNALIGGIFTVFLWPFALWNNWKIFEKSDL
jgi:hypothetical protein